MVETLLNKISKQSNSTIVTDAWLTGQTGGIVDLKGDCIFRFIDYDTEGELRIKHTTEESKLSCPVVACGFVGYWLHRKDSEGTKTIFDGYYELRLKEYEKAHECDEDAWERDFKKEFVCRHHIPTEKKWIKASEALFPYITENDRKKVRSIMDNYLKYARSKRKQLYPPTHPAKRIIEETFLDAYRIGGPAYECMMWMRKEYKLPYMGPHCDNGGVWENKSFPEKIKARHDKLNPENIAEQFEDFNTDVLMYPNGGLMDEINENLRNSQTQEERIRYIISLLQPFKEFADAFNAKARIDERKRSIKEHEEWIKDWEGMPDDAIDERTGKPIRPKDQIAACVESIEEYKQDIEYWEKVQQDFYWFAQHGLGAGDYRVYPQAVNDEMCKYLGGWWKYMILFARRLAALCLTYGIKLMDVQERCEIYLMWQFRITDYVDNKHVTTIEHARKLLDEIDTKNPKNQVNNDVAHSVKAESKEADKMNLGKGNASQKMDSDFEHLKTWQDNPDLKYYLSDKHWNFHVNQLLYAYLTSRYKGNEVGVYINLVLGNGENAYKIDYSQIYGVMFNEAYFFCSFVLTNPAPETEITFLESKAEALCSVKLAKSIIAYNTLVMTGLLLCFANDKNDAVGRFLNRLLGYNHSHYFGDKFHHFEDYMKIGLGCVSGIMIDGQIQSPGKLRPGYDYKGHDEYLRKTLPWYKVSAEMFEKRLEESSCTKNEIEKNLYDILCKVEEQTEMIRKLEKQFINIKSPSKNTENTDLPGQSKLGAKEKKFADYVIDNTETDKVIYTIRQKINNSDAQQTAFVIIGGIEAGKIRRDVSSPSIEKEFGVKGGSVKPYLTKYRKYKDGINNAFSEEELKPYKELYNKI